MVKKLPHKTFLKSFLYVPRVAISLLIKNKNNKVLLTQRANPPLVDFWHLPGSFLLKGEKITECIERIFIDELGVSFSNINSKFVCISEDLNNDPRGHVIDLVYQCMINDYSFRPTDQTKALQFFSKLPQDISFNHEDLLRTLGYI